MSKTIYYKTSQPEVFYTIENVYNQVWYRISPFGNEPDAESICKDFKILKRKWVKETQFLSNPILIYKNQHYKNIIQLGIPVVPYLLSDLKNNNTDWIFALKEILKIDPVPKEHNGFFNLMKNDWLKWANNMGYEYGHNDISYAYQDRSGVPQLI